METLFDRIKRKHEPENMEDDCCMDYPGEHQEFDEGAALQQFRDCFREDIE